MNKTRPLTPFQILEQLEATNSSNEKIEILKEHENNELLKLIVKKALDPMNLYFIRKVPEQDKESKTQVRLDSIINKLDRISSRQVTGNDALHFLRSVLSQVSKEDASIIRRIVAKDLRCGVGISTVNEAWGKNFIPKFDVMLCTQYKEKAVAKLEWPTIVQEKMDGMRVNFIVNQQGVDVRGRSGKEIHIGDLFSKELRNFLYMYQLDDKKEYVIDGELLVKTKDGSFLSRKKANGILNKAIHGTISDEEKNDIYAIIWDIVPKSAFTEGAYSPGYIDRITYLNLREQKMKESYPDLRRVSVIESRVCESMDNVLEFYTEVITRKGEGVIIKNQNSGWKNKRVNHQIKMKIENECELLIKEVVGGEGRLRGKLGSFLCESKDGELSVNVGTGFSDTQREEFFSENMVGQVVTVKFNEVISSKKADKKSLFLPVFIEHRLDKGRADTLKTIEKM